MVSFCAGMLQSSRSPRETRKPNLLCLDIVTHGVVLDH